MIDWDAPPSRASEVGQMLSVADGSYWVVHLEWRRLICDLHRLCR